MRKVDDGEEKEKEKKEKKEKEKKEKRMAFLVATTSLPAVYRPNADRWNAARSRQLQLQLHFGLEKLQVYYSSIVTVFEKVTVTVSVRDYKVAYASFQAGRRPARKLVLS